MRSGGPTRGQATVEMALGLLVFITVLVFGIYFGEVGYLSLKVQEATTSALWDTTAAKMHRYEVLPATVPEPPHGVTHPAHAPMDDAIQRAGPDATTRHNVPIKNVFAEISELDVRCQRELNLSPMRPKPDRAILTLFEDMGGMGCTADATLGLTDRFPKSFLDQANGFFTAKNWDAQGAAASGRFKVCGAGRAWGGACTGQLAMLLDDYGYSGLAENQECALGPSPCASVSIYNMVQARYNEAGRAQGSRGSKLVEGVIKQTSPIDENKYFISVRGEDSSIDLFQEVTPGGDKDPNDWHTSPGFSSRQPNYRAGYQARYRCFLGTNQVPTGLKTTTDPNCSL